MITAMKAMEKVFSSFDPVHPFDPIILDQQIRKLYQSEISMSQLFTVFSSLALFIACIGLLGLVSFITEQKTREIGIRKVMGASVTQIVMMISKDFFILIGIAFILAVPIAWYAMQHWLQDFAIRIELHYAIFIAAALLTLCIAWLSISANAIRSASRNPVDSLRYE
jgi:putative ABC transport system permease protein